MTRGLGILLAAASTAMIGAAKAEESAVRISKWDAAPVFVGDGWEFKIGGRMMIDYSNLEADEANADFSNTDLRRFRLNVGGKFGENLKYKAEINIGDDGVVNLEDGYVQWAPTGDDWNVQVGHFKTQNSLEEQASSRFISTFERGAFTDTFDLNRRVGVAVNAKGERYTFSAGVFGDNIDVDDIEEGYALAARGTFIPIKSDNTLVHMGASVRYRKVGDTQSDLRYRQKPYVDSVGRIISTGNIADSDVFVGTEVAVYFKNFWAAGEYAVTFADCSAAAACGDVTFGGGYGEVGVFIGGKRSHKGGKFARPNIHNPVTKGGLGALALVARIDTIDLTDGSVNGGNLNTYVLGAEWWMTKYTHMGVNFIQMDADVGTSTSGLEPVFAELVTAGVAEEDVTGALFRAQFDF